MRTLHAVGACFVLLAGLAAAQNAPTTPPKTGPTPDKASAYYHYSLGHLYSELAGAYGNRGEYFNKAVDNYRAALAADPSATFIAEELSDLYIQSGRLRDAVTEAEDLLKKDPNDLNSRRILARIYSRLIGDEQQNKIDETMLKKAIEQYQKITEASPNDLDSWLMLGRLDKVAQDSTGAEKAFRHVLSVDPNNDDAMTGLAMVYGDLGDSRKAADLLRQVAEKNPTARSYEALANAYEQMKDYPLAAEALRKALSMSQDNAGDLKKALAADLLMADQSDEALKLYQELLTEDPKDVQSQLRISQIYRKERQFDKARQAAEKARQMDPDNLEVRYNDVQVLEAEGKLSEAITELNQILDSTEKKTYAPPERRNRAVLLDGLASLYRNNEQFAQAAATYKRIVDLDPDYGGEASAQIVDTWRAAKEYGRAEQAANDAVKAYPKDRMVQSIHASLMADLGRYDQAVAETKKLMDGKHDRETWLSLAEVYEKQKNFPEMAKAIDQADKLSISKEDKAAVAFMRGAMYERLKKYDQAEAEFRKVLDTDPDNSSALNYLGYMLADNNTRLDEAHQLIQKAVDREPNNYAFLDSLGWVYFRMNKLPEAEEQLRRALQRMSNDPTVHDHLGDVYFHEGKTREAIAQWQNSLQDWRVSAPSDQDENEVAKVQKKLESARVRLARETGMRQDEKQP
ncbi:MAG TPA: tetratricopeptide repeat protein [Bryobacteraceae bacterium]|nr:tetratricopeptide repeat protein [Bryobacteraceae bacterium]